MTRRLGVAALLAAGLSTQGVAQTGPEITISRGGSRPSEPASTEHFSGPAHVERWFVAEAPSRMAGATVTFEAGSRTAWHTHPLGQILIVTAGTGRVQQWGGPVREIRPGDVVRTPPNVKHWHGASPNESMTHIALSEHLDGRSVTWMEPVDY